MKSTVNIFMMIIFLENESDLLNAVINLVEHTSPYFWIILDEKSGLMAGFVFLSNLVGSSKQLHSAEITTCFKREFWGEFTKKSSKKFIKYCFKKYKLRKIKATIFENNLRVRAILKISGFKKEGILRGETLKNGELQNVEIYSILRKKEVKNGY